MATKITRDAINGLITMSDDNQSLGSVSIQLTDSTSKDKNGVQQGTGVGTSGKPIYLRKVKVGVTQPDGTCKQRTMVILCSDVFKDSDDP